MSRIAVTALLLTGCLAACSPTAPNHQVAPAATVAQPTPVGVPVSGLVHDAVVRPIAGALVEVVDGSGAGRSAVTDHNGRYQLPGTFTGTISVRASRDGFFTATRTYTPEQWNQYAALFFRLESSTPATDLTGDYTMTFAAARECTQLPVPARQRTYRAEVTRGTNGVYGARLQGATLYNNVFPIFVVGNFARFWIEPWGDIFPLIELMTPSTSLTLTYDVGVSVGETSVSAPFLGTFAYCSDHVSDSGPGTDCAVPLVQCTSSSHTFSLTRH